ncbi:MAG: hypothetical protein A2Y33_14705 [Spirochaetes bacterium GWF1_51_8]|nr:MAG: hypothetical protein A2Y33_14705 [Spirochaetes bacterium GWF1_51_8]
MTDEKEIIRRAKEGSLVDFEKLLSLYKKRVFGVIYLHLRNRADAEDLFQEVFYRVFRGLKSYDPGRSFFTWIYTVTLNAVRTYLAKKKARNIETSIEFFEDAVFQDTESFSAEDKIMLFKALDALPLEERQLIFLRYMQGIGLSEIAEMTGLSEDNVKVKLHRIRKKLEKEMEGHDENK